MPKQLKDYPKGVNRECLRFSGMTVLPICIKAPRCRDCRKESNRVFARRSKLKTKKQVEDLQRESLELETELDDHKESCDEIWAEKLAYEHEVEELIPKR